MGFLISFFWPHESEMHPFEGEVDSTDLLHQAWHVHDQPAFAEEPIADNVDHHAPHVDGLLGRGDAEKVAAVGACPCESGDDGVPLGYLFIDRPVAVGKAA